MSSAKASLIEHLAGIPLFSACSKRELNQLSGLTSELTVPSGRVLVKQGAVGYELFVIADGVATVSIDGKAIAELKSGDVFGELSLLDKGARSAQVQSETQCTLIILTQREFDQALETIPGLSTKVLRNLAMRLRNTNKLLVHD
jgi:CRP/FNR family transcriptional regulator, cyclic AMP receptor protein